MAIFNVGRALSAKITRDLSHVAMASGGKGTCVATGDIIGNSAAHIAGDGSYVRGQNIHSALTGFVRIVPDGERPRLEVYRANFKPSVVPVPGNQVICKVCEKFMPLTQR